MAAPDADEVGSGRAGWTAIRLNFFGFDKIAPDDPFGITASLLSGDTVSVTSDPHKAQADFIKPLVGPRFPGTCRVHNSMTIR